ncbi:hypothetical protein NSK_006436 [Nannochloropsis salina CCMP1776]|uniref:Uncharacterized protein n=1 Tax=Nannochloropsis salina CCMP1776 TaxID=1027361 RepID=A0A4D9CW37_9STRA|nr:hypothetical protein NSK_006436 [Nannochloropsis salina CCMP1776]|eukprot:TFJ82317.1 hypothetical protein NSK_006436 [Nannochloropsis salina CCMP1776]
MGFYSGIGRLFFAKATRKAFADKEKQERVKALLPIYQPAKLIPNDTSLTLRQGGVIVVRHGREGGKEGGEVVFRHLDEGTGAHAAWEEVLAAVGGK